MRTGVDGQQKFRATRQRFAGPKILDLLEAASKDLLQQAQEVMTSPKFSRTQVTTSQFEKLRKDELEALVRALKDKGTLLKIALPGPRRRSSTT